MYHEHPLRILKYSVKNIWLLIFPLIRNLRNLEFNKDFFYNWIQGAWFDVLILAIILIFGIIQWFLSEIDINEDNIIHKEGILIKVKTIIPVSSISTFTIESPMHLSLFGAYRVHCDTRAGIFRTADLKLLLKKQVCSEIEKNFKVQSDNQKTTEIPKPSLFSILIFSYLFSSGFSGIIYIIIFLFKGGDIAQDIITLSLSKITSETEKLTNHWIIHIPSVAIVVGSFFGFSWLISFIVNVARYLRFKVEYDNRYFKVSHGIYNHIESHICFRHINYTDYRQNLIMKMFSAVAIHISCSGYGSTTNRLPVIIPVILEKNLGKELEPIKIKGKLKGDYRAKKSGFLSYLLLPLVASIIILPLFDKISFYLPQFYDLLFFVSIMLEIPSLWLIIVKLTALNTSGISVYEDNILIRYSKWTNFYTVTSPISNITKVEIQQNLLQKMSGLCSVSISIGSEEHKHCMVRAMNISDGLQISEMLNSRISTIKQINISEKSLDNNDEK